MLNLQIIPRRENPDQTIKSFNFIDKLTVSILKDNLPRNELRNRNISTCWNVALEPWETIVAGQGLLLKTIQSSAPNVYKIMINNGDVITKEARLWHKDKKVNWVNPVFETIQNSDQSTVLPVVISSSPKQSYVQEDLEQVIQWRNTNPLTTEPIYYESLLLMMMGKYDEFIQKANNYLFNCNKMTNKVIMMRYYLASIFCHVKRSPKQSLENLLIPLSLKPLMAEFWCLLGDIYHFISGDYKKAGMFYRNAMVMGKERSTTDHLPIQISKYEKYPKLMLESHKFIQSIL
jgi:tetratricopeptide (TPR) repeat protein